MWYDSFICVTWLIFVRDVTHWYVTRAKESHCARLIRSGTVTWLIFVRDVTHSYVTHAKGSHCARLIRSGTVTWLILARDVTHSYVTHAQESHCTRLIRSGTVTWLIFVRDVTHSYMTHSKESHCARSIGPGTLIWLILYVIWLIHMLHRAKESPSARSIRSSTVAFCTWRDSFVCDSCERMTMRLYISPPSHVNESCHMVWFVCTISHAAYKFDRHAYGDMWHDSFVQGDLWHVTDIFVYGMTYSAQESDHVTWLPVCASDMTHLYVTWPICMWHDPLICDVTHSFIRWLIRVWHASFAHNMTQSHVAWLIRRWQDAWKNGSAQEFDACSMRVCTYLLSKCTYILDKQKIKHQNINTKMYTCIPAYMQRAKRYVGMHTYIFVFIFLCCIFCLFSMYAHTCIHAKCKAICVMTHTAQESNPICPFLPSRLSLDSFLPPSLSLSPSLPPSLALSLSLFVLNNFREFFCTCSWITHRIKVRISSKINAQLRRRSTLPLTVLCMCSCLFFPLQKNSC